MEELLKFFNLDMIISATVVTFVVSAINTIQNKVSTNWLVFIVSILVTVLRITLDWSDWQNVIFQILITMSFAVLFYNYIGRWFVDNLFNKIKEKFSK